MSKNEKGGQKRTAFDVWWSSHSLRLRGTLDPDFERRRIRAGDVAGTKPSRSKFRFRTGEAGRKRPASASKLHPAAYDA